MADIASRRGFLTALATVTAAGTAAIAAVARPEIADAALLALAPTIEAAERRYITAHAEKEAAKVRLRALCPVPDDLVASEEGPAWFAACEEKDFEGHRVEDEKRRVRRIVTKAGLLDDVENYGPRTKIGKAARRKLKVAEVYEAAFRDATIASGMRVAWDAYLDAERGLTAMVRAITAEPAHSLAGVAVKIRAIQTHGKHQGVGGWSWLVIESSRKLHDEVLELASREVQA